MRLCIKQFICIVLIIFYFLGITDKIIAGICKILTIVLPRYRDNHSQYLIKDLLKSLIKEHPKWTLRSLPPVLAEIANQNKNLQAT